MAIIQQIVKKDSHVLTFVYLPKEIVSELGLVKGEEVSCDVVNGKLIISKKQVIL